MLFCVSTEKASGSAVRAAQLAFSVSLLPQGAVSGASLSMRTSDRHASLSADRSSFVAYIREFSSCRLIYQRQHPHQGFDVS